MTAPAGANLRDRVVLITGAARGIGRALVRQFADTGARLALLGHNADDLRAVARAHPSTSIAIAGCDVGDSGQVNAGVATLRAELGPIDVVINNAGVVVRKPTGEMTDAEWRWLHAINTDGPFFVARACLQDLRARRGRLINIASIAGQEGTALLAAYSASKHALLGLTRSLAKELRADGVMVVAVCPGSVDTDMLKIGMPGGIPSLGPDDVATLTLYLATQAPFAMTGGCVDLHG